MLGWLARRDVSVVAVDFNVTMLAELLRRHPDSPVRGTVKADVLRLPLPDDLADLTLNLRLSHHIEDDETVVRMLRELRRVTRHRLITTFQSTYTLHHLKRKLRGRRQHHVVRSPRTFRRCCREAGLRIESWVPVRRFRQEDVVVVCRPR